MEDISKLKDNALISASYDTLLQVLLRIVSFMLNAFIIRSVSASVFAVINVRLHLLYATGLLLSREAFRRATLGCKSSKDIKKVVNLIWLGAGLSIPLSLVGLVMWTFVMESPPLEVTSHYQLGVILILLSIIVEVCTESPYIMAELHMWAKVKVFIEGFMHLSRSFFLALGVTLWPQKAVLVFAISHLIGSLLYCCAFYSVFAIELSHKERAKKLLFGNFRSLFVTFGNGRFIPDVDNEMLLVSISFMKQGWWKEALTEGELYLMNLFPLISLSEQGVYQVVNNLGSLAARVIFRSIEGAAYKFFAQTLRRGTLIKDQDSVKMKQLCDFLSTLLKNIILISFFMATFGWAYSDPLLYLYGGWSLSTSGRGLLRSHFLYIICMSLNGITEAFTFAAMSDTQLARHNHTLCVFSIIYVLVTVVSIQVVGVFGFVIGNCVNMILRCFYSLLFIKKLFEGSGLEPLSPLRVSKRIICGFCCAFLLTSLSEAFVYPSSLVAHILVGGVTAFFVLLALRREAKEIITTVFGIVDSVYTKVYPKQSKKDNYNFYIINLIDQLLYK